VLVEHGYRRCEMPAKIGIHPVEGALMHAMPAWVPAARASGVKWIASFSDNCKFKLSQTSGLLILNCPETGWPLCVLDASWVTAKRTPAVTALASKHLARTDADTVGLIGAGVQGREHIAMLAEVIPTLKCIRVTDRLGSSAKALIRDIQPKISNVELVPCKTIEEVVRGTSIIISATAILAHPKPEVRDEWIEPGAFVAPIDFDSLWERETFTRADKFLVDSRNELDHLMAVGRLSNGLPRPYAELGEVIAGLKPGRETDSELIVNMNIGMAVEDVVVGWELFDRACKLNLGRLLPV
jgi:ornithine cyclodeaminase/alanine dehydrogenase-like protein (mu-crystallin family)